MVRVRLACVTLAVAAMAGCGSQGRSTQTPSKTEPVQTSASHYELIDDGEWLRTTIPYTFTNATGEPVYFVNCNGQFGINLERRGEDGYESVWSPAMPQCLSPPIVVGPGATLDRTLEVTAGSTGSNRYPQFDVEDPSGTYRIVLTDALSSFDADSRPFGEPIGLEHRLSNEFTLELR